MVAVTLIIHTLTLSPDTQLCLVPLLTLHCSCHRLDRFASPGHSVLILEPLLWFLEGEASWITVLLQSYLPWFLVRIVLQEHYQRAVMSVCLSVHQSSACPPGLVGRTYISKHLRSACSSPSSPLPVCFALSSPSSTVFCLPCLWHLQFPGTPVPSCFLHLVTGLLSGPLGSTWSLAFQNLSISIEGICHVFCITLWHSYLFVIIYTFVFSLHALSWICEL